MTKSILITGCSTGIGRCVAEGLAARGYQVFATAREPEQIQELDRIEGIRGLYLDLRNSESIQTAVERVFEETGGELYALFNNGGYGQPGAVEDLRREVMREQFETLVFGWLELTNLVLPAMRRAGEGRIIQNSSVLGFVALPFRGAYNAAKFAIEGMSDTLRMELYGSGIHVSLVEPGPVISKFRTNAMKAFQKNITVEGSAFEAQYRGVLGRLQKEGPAAPGTLPPEAVLKKVIHALESPKPRARYYVTWPTYFFGYLKRVLPTRMMDKVLMAVSKGEMAPPDKS
ncbi:MAG: SDR family NAD(P)-dependent oxidoreductase [Gammaproteobacteria bacterium]